MQHDSPATTFLFTDIEGSTRLWEQEPVRMRPALARHDAIARSAVESNRGRVVKTTGDGLHAAFADPLDALRAALALQRALHAAQPELGIALPVRCGLHAGPSESRDSDFYGGVVNRAARVMSAAHGGQMLVSRAVAEMVSNRLPADVGLRDLGDVRLRDLASPERLFQVVCAGLRADFPALRSLEQTPNNLPHALTAFIGRERALAETARLIASHRLVTVVGMGGLGKTRLALHAAAGVLDDFSDGVWLVELAAIQDARRVSQAVASALGVREEAGSTLEEALLRYAKGRRALIVLDNCEHLLGECAQLARRILNAGEGIRILASSREPLKVAGEAVYQLAGLEVPGPRQAVDPQAAARTESVRLFLDRAASAAPRLAFTPEQASVVAAICHRLEGIPLAIELAAARVRTLSLQQIALRLDDRFRLLAAGDPSVPQKQRTLRALIDWSHDLLGEPERALFASLAVFAEGWTLEACESVCERGDGGEIVDDLARLVEKSLVAMDPGGERYRMLETMREYAREKLAASGAGAAVRERHFAYYLAFAEKAKAGLTGPDQAAWLATLDRERENILLAHAHALQHAESAEPGLRLANAVKLYWANRGLLELGHRVVREALGRTAATDRTFLRCRGLYEAGQLSSYMGRYGEARHDLEESLAIARELQDERAISIVLPPLGMAALGQGDLEAARGYLAEGLEGAERGGNSRALAAASMELGQLERVEGNAERAQALYDRALRIAEEIDDRETVAIARLNMAMLRITQGNLTAARTLLAQGLDIAAEVGSRRMVQCALEIAAGLAASQGEWRRAARLFGAASSLARSTGLHREPADEAFLRPLVELARQAPGARFEADESDGRALGLAQATAEARDGLTSR
ncbi:MAG: tetratricopeptide repeat protein [Usitatibacter sp.]